MNEYQWLAAELDLMLKLLNDDNNIQNNFIDINWPYFDTYIHEKEPCALLKILKNLYSQTEINCYIFTLDTYDYELTLIGQANYFFTEMHLLAHQIAKKLNKEIDSTDKYHMTIIELGCLMVAALATRRYFNISHLTTDMVSQILTTYKESIIDYNVPTDTFNSDIMKYGFRWFADLLVQERKLYN